MMQFCVSEEQCSFFSEAMPPSFFSSVKTDIGLMAHIRWLGSVFFCLEGEWFPVGEVVQLLSGSFLNVDEYPGAVIFF